MMHCTFYSQKLCHIVTDAQITDISATSLRGDSWAGLLDDLHQHATGLHVGGRTDRLPTTYAVLCDGACAAQCEPPSALGIHCAVVGNPDVIIAVWSTELHSVGGPLWQLCSHESIAGISAVPAHRQLILTNLITDGERRVFSRVPQTVSTLDLHKTTTHHRQSFILFSSQYYDRQRNNTAESSRRSVYNYSEKLH